MVFLRGCNSEGLKSGVRAFSLQGVRERFINLVNSGGLPFAQLCARFGISRKTGYKWLNRFRAEGAAGLLEKDRVPRSHPRRTAGEIEAVVGEIHALHPAWKGGSIRTALRERGIEPLPAVTTIDAICRRLDEARAAGGANLTMKGRPAPNDVWELSLGPVSPSAGINHRAVVLRDVATDFVLGAEVVAERGEQGCREVLWALFARHGLPRRLRWPVESAPGDLSHHTPLTVAVLKLGVGVVFFAAHGVLTPGATATNAEWLELEKMLRRTGEGAEVRARLRAAGAGNSNNATAEGEAASLARLPNEVLSRWRGRLSAWADRHNAPTTAISGAATPAARYRPSPRRLEAVAESAAVNLGSADVETRRVSEKGIVHLGGHRWVIGRAFAGEAVTVRSLPNEAGVAVDFGGWPLGIATSAETAATGEAWAYRLGAID